MTAAKPIAARIIQSELVNDPRPVGDTVVTPGVTLEETGVTLVTPGVTPGAGCPVDVGIPVGGGVGGRPDAPGIGVAVVPGPVVT